MERLPNRYPKISQSHKVPLYKGLSLFYPKLHKNSGIVRYWELVISDVFRLLINDVHILTGQSCCSYAEKPRCLRCKKNKAEGYSL